MTTFLLASVLSFLLVLAIVLTLMRLDMARDASTSDRCDDQPLWGGLIRIDDRHSVMRDLGP
jgi:hypothetical protein